MFLANVTDEKPMANSSEWMKGLRYSFKVLSTQGALSTFLIEENSS